MGGVPVIKNQGEDAPCRGTPRGLSQEPRKSARKHAKAGREGRTNKGPVTEKKGC